MKTNRRNGIPPTLAMPPRADYPHIKLMINPRGANRACGCAKARHRMIMGGRPRANQPISVHHAGHYYYAETQSKTWIRSSVALLRDRNIQTPCGWQHEDGSMCGAPAIYCDCAMQFVAAHDTRNMAADIKALCRWCPLSPKRKVIQHNLGICRRYAYDALVQKKDS